MRPSHRCPLLRPPSLCCVAATANTLEEALVIAAEIGKYPIIIRPAFTLGGTGGGIAYNIDELKEIVSGGLQVRLCVCRGGEREGVCE